jgi:molybdate transport system ATP-binding protein
MTAVALRAVVESRGVDVEFDVAAGEVLAILGPNGAGKSTALHVIAGLVRPDRGEVRVGQRILTDTGAGVHVTTHDRRVGLLLQDPLLFPHLNVTRNVAFAPRSSRAAAAYWLDEVDAADLGDRMPRQLSGGQAQRVALARALAAEPDVLLLDEPLAGMGAEEASRMVTLLKKLSPGHAILLVEHDMDAVFAVADVITVMVDGQVLETGSPGQIRASHSVRAVYLGQEAVPGEAGDGGMGRQP